jgi:acetylornithine/succinyldiaminopimelate/putrescine aminotransferase
MHFSSHQNDPIQGAVLEFMIKYLTANKFLGKIRRQGKYFLRQLERLAEKRLGLINPRGLGLMLAFDLKLSNAAARSQNDYPSGQKLISILEKKGIAIQAVNRGRTFRILPSYTIAESEIDLFIKKLEEALHEL